MLNDAKKDLSECQALQGIMFQGGKMTLVLLNLLYSRAFENHSLAEPIWEKQKNLQTTT